MNSNDGGNRWYKRLWRPRFLIRLWVLIAAALVAIVPLLVWYGDKDEEWEYKRLEHHESLLFSIDGVSCEHGNTRQIRAQSELSRQLKLCWLYCSDAVIEEGYALMERVEQDAEYTPVQRSRALLNFMNTIRIEMFPDKTNLSDDIAGTLETCVNE